MSTYSSKISNRLKNVVFYRKKEEDFTTNEDDSEGVALEIMEVVDIESKETTNQECDPESHAVTITDSNVSLEDNRNPNTYSNENTVTSRSLPTYGNISEAESSHERQNQQLRNSSVGEQNVLNGNSNNNNVQRWWQDNSLNEQSECIVSDDGRDVSTVIYDASSDDRTMRDLQKRHLGERRRVVNRERERLAHLRKKNDAAILIQRNWRK